MLLYKDMTKKELDYQAFERNAKWKIRDVSVYKIYKMRRQKLPPELEEKRYNDMVFLYDDVKNYSFIAKFYELDRAQVYRIINKIPNKTKKHLI